MPSRSPESHPSPSRRNVPIICPIMTPVTNLGRAKAAGLEPDFVHDCNVQCLKPDNNNTAYGMTMLLTYSLQLQQFRKCETGDHDSYVP